MGDKLPEALEFDAAEVAEAPLLGYRIVELAGPGDSSPGGEEWQLRVSQPWIETENDPVTISIGLFAACRPLHGLLIKAPEASGFVASLPDALAAFGSRWAISSRLQDRASSSASAALAVDGGDAEALVWREGMVIGASEPLATALRLLMAGFSAEARRAHVQAQPLLLWSALRLLPGDVKSLYVPGADDFMQQAESERRERVARKQAWLKARAPKFRIGSDGVRLIRVRDEPPPDAPGADN
jgi:hypothetical protein